MDTVVVSGGTFGIGYEIAEYLSQNGYQVIAFGLFDAQPGSVASGRPGKSQVNYIELDLTREGDIKSFAEELRSKRVNLTGLVNNAAIGPLGTIETMDIDLIRKVYEVNIIGAISLTKILLPMLRMTHKASIINIGSGSMYGKPNMLAYGSSKGALLSFTKCLARDLFGDGIRVNMIIPGGGGITAGISDFRRKGDKKTTALDQPNGSVAGRPISGIDVAHATAFFLDSKSETISGTVLDVGCFSEQGAS